MGRPGCDSASPSSSQMFLYNSVGQNGITNSVGEGRLPVLLAHRKPTALGAPLEPGLGVTVGGSGKWRFSA